MTFPLPPLTDEQRAIVDLAEALARERLAPRAAKYDEESSFPYESYRDLHESGLLALTVPKAYGGLGADPITYAHVLRHIGRGCPATGLTFNMHCTDAGFLGVLGTEEQKRRYFADGVERGARVASITSEPGQSYRGTFQLQTVFRRVNGGWHVAGVKQFCSLGDAADYYFLTGIGEGMASAKDGIISAMIPRDDPGVKVEGTWNATGMRGTISHTIRYDCQVPDANIVGAPGAFSAIDVTGFALGYAAVYLGIGEAAFEFITDYVRT